MNLLIIKNMYFVPSLGFPGCLSMFCRRGGGGVPEICPLDTGNTYADQNKARKNKSRDNCNLDNTKMFV